MSSASQGISASPSLPLRETSVKGSAGRAGATALAIRIASAGVAFAAQAVVARLTGAHEFGIFALAWVWFLAIAAVANLGFGDGTIRWLPQMRALGEDDFLRGYLRRIPQLVSASAAIIGGLTIAALFLARPWLGEGYLLPFALMALTLPVVCLQSILEGVGRSYEWVVPALLPVYILRHGLMLAYMVAAVWAGAEPTAGLAFGCVFLAAFSSLVYQAVAIRGRLQRVLPPGPRAYRTCEWLIGAAPFTVLHGSSVLFSFVDVMVLSVVVGPAEAAVYFAATRIIQVVNLIPYAAKVAGSHRFSDAYARGAAGEIQALAGQMALITFASALLCLIAIAVGGKLLLGAFGAGFESGYLPLLILAIGLLGAMAAGPAEEILNMTGHGAVSARTSAVLIVLSVALNFALAIPWDPLESTCRHASLSIL